MNVTICNAMIFDGTGRAPFPGDVCTECDRIAEIDETGIAAVAPGGTAIDGKGRMLMRGLVEVHGHRS